MLTQQWTWEVAIAVTKDRLLSLLRRVLAGTKNKNLRT